MHPQREFTAHADPVDTQDKSARELDLENDEKALSISLLKFISRGLINTEKGEDYIVSAILR